MRLLPAIRTRRLENALLRAPTTRLCARVWTTNRTASWRPSWDVIGCPARQQPRLATTAPLLAIRTHLLPAMEPLLAIRTRQLVMTLRHRHPRHHRHRHR